MANLGQKSGVYHVRFRFRTKEYKKSLKTRDRAAAEAALHLIALTVHRLHTGQIRIPDGVDAGDFIVSGGTLQKPVQPAPIVASLLSTKTLIEVYTESQKNLLAPSYHYSQSMHLRHLARHLGGRVNEPCDRVNFRDLDGYLKARLAVRHPNTAERERVTLLQFYKWAAMQGYVAVSPAVGLAPISPDYSPLLGRSSSEAVSTR